MAIYLTEGFHLNSNQPFDVRAVVGPQSYYLSKDDILYRYPGLRVWDFSGGGDGLPYVWTGATWSSENSIGATINDNSGNLNYIAKFYNDTTILGRSLIYDNNTHIGIGLTSASISPGSLITGLHVKGNIRTNNNFIGDGSQITQINASNITSGILTLNRLAVRSPFTPGTKYFLNLIDNNISWQELNTDPIITLETSSNIPHYINFTSLSSGQDNINASTELIYIPSRQQVLNGLGSYNFPSYSFNGNDDKGMFWNSSTSELTLKGASNANDGFVTIFSSGLSVNHSDYPQISFKNNTNNRLLWVNNSNILLFRENATVMDDKKVWHESNLYHLRQVNVDNKLEILRNSNSSTTNAYGTPITGIYSYNLIDDTTNMQPSISSLFPVISDKHKYWSNIVIGNGTSGSFQIAGNWHGASASDREMLVRSLNNNNTNWSEWSRVCLNEIQGFKWSMGRTQSTRDMLKIWMSNNLPKTIKTATFDIGGTNSTDVLIPFNPTIPSLTTTNVEDIYGTRLILGQSWHNIPGYEIRYAHNGSGVSDSSITFVMFKITSGSNMFVSGLMSEWSLHSNSVSSSYVSVGNGYSYDATFIGPTRQSSTAVVNFVNLYSSRSGFSTVRVYLRENESITQAMTAVLELRQRIVSDLPI